MYHWVKQGGQVALNVLSAGFAEMVRVQPRPTLFEADFYARFEEYRQDSAVSYVIVITPPPRSPDKKPYYIHPVFNDDLFGVLQQCRQNGLDVPIIFRTDLDFKKQWPYSDPGWIFAPKDIGWPVHHYRFPDERVVPLKARPGFIRGVVQGGLS